VATTLTVNGVGYLYPNTGDQQWGSAASAWALAVTNGMLQKAGGNFTLTADVNFGANFGVISSYFTSRTANASTAGAVRLASTDSVGFRNNANGANVLLAKDASDNLTWNGHILSSSAGIVPAAAGGTGINSSASTGVAIVTAGTWSIPATLSVALGGTNLASYTTGDMLYASGATTLAKLTIGTANKVQVSTGSAPSWALLVDANVDAAAALARSKIAAGTNDHVVINSGAGALSSEATLAVTRGGLALSTVAIGEMLYGSGANTYAKLAAGTSGQFFQSGGGGAPNWRTGYILGSFQIFTSNGTWTRPSGCRAVFVELVGSGGGSGGCQTTGVGEAADAGGGGGGGYSRKWITAPGSTETVTVGVAGTAGSAGNNAGGAGNPTSFGAHLSATGGGAGSGSATTGSSTLNGGGAGGVGSSGDVNINGSDGGNGRVAAGARFALGWGGASFFAGMRQAPSTAGAGNAGRNYGGGAAGASLSASTGQVAGAAGGPGLVIVWEYY
jgi:hypothetical protein